MKTEKLKNGDIEVTTSKGSIIFRDRPSRGGLVWVDWTAGSSDAPDYPTPTIVAAARAAAEEMLATERAA